MKPHATGKGSENEWVLVNIQPISDMGMFYDLKLSQSSDLLPLPPIHGHHFSAVTKSSGGTLQFPDLELLHLAALVLIKHGFVGLMMIDVPLHPLPAS